MADVIENENVEEKVDSPVEEQPTVDVEATQEVQEAQEVEETPVEDSEAQGESKEESSNIEIVETGNEVFDTLISTLADVGIDYNVYGQEIQKQIDAGETDIGLTQESFDELVEHFGEKVALIMERQYLNELKSVYQERNSRTQEVYNKFGGEEALKDIFTSIDKEKLISNEDTQELKNMLMEGGIKQDLAVKRLKEIYMDSTEFTQNPTLVSDGDTVQPSGIEPISRGEYTKAKLEAMNSKDYAKVEALNKRAKFTMENKQTLWR